MCFTLEPANLSNTILYAAEAFHNGKIVHVMGYQNTAENLSNGPNAMLLPIPTNAPLGPENVLDMREAKNVLKDYVTAIKPKGRSRGFGKFLGDANDSDEVQVFESGSYTVVLAKDARDVTSAFGRVPANRRPKNLKQEVFDAYAKWYPGWPIALCVWDGRVEAEPMLWWYEPKNPVQLFLPALDGHGSIPDLAEKVTVDHSVIVGSVTEPAGSTVYFLDFAPYNPADGKSIPEALRPFLASRVRGRVFSPGTRLINGDFTIPVSGIASQNIQLSRVQPPGA